MRNPASPCKPRFVALADRTWHSRERYAMLELRSRPNASPIRTQASSVVPDFVPAYLCLADVSGQLRQWSHTLEFADHAVKLDPVQNLYGHFYLAIAHFHLSQFSGVEKNALQTIDADHLHRLPQVHLLPAQIYGSRHDLKSAATQLRAYLLAAPKSPDAPTVRKSLEDLESQIST
jgi:hypothetical protein